MIEEIQNPAYYPLENPLDEGAVLVESGETRCDTSISLAYAKEKWPDLYRIALKDMLLEGDRLDRALAEMKRQHPKLYDQVMKDTMRD